MKPLFWIPSRRAFLTKIIACTGFTGIFYQFFRGSDNFPLKVTRIVHYPRQLSQDEFESMSDHYCDHVSIRAFTNQLISQRKIVGYDEDFSNKYFVKYTLFFSDIESYNSYLRTINEYWFDLLKFKEMGFSVNIETNSQIA